MGARCLLSLIGPDLKRGREPLVSDRPLGSLRVNQAGGSEVAPVCLMYCFSRSFRCLFRRSATLAACTSPAAFAHLGQIASYNLA